MANFKFFGSRGNRFSLVAALLLLTACGGAAPGGVGPDGPGQGLTLVEFLQSNQDTVPINTQLEFHFSEAVNSDTVNSATFQIRKGPTFGEAVEGAFTTDGTVAVFSPSLPTLCDKSDAGLVPGVTYRVIVLGHPEEFAVKSSVGQALDQTSTYEFRTLPEASPDHLQDQIPGVRPRVKTCTPEDGTAALGVAADNSVECTLTENVDPCSIRLGDTVLAHVYELGDVDKFLEAPNGNESGFDPVEDADDTDPYTWGGNGTPLSPPLTLSATLELEQSFVETTLILRPTTGGFPENALVVVELTLGILDFGGSPLEPETISFTTENLPRGEKALQIEYDDTTPIDGTQTSADVNTTRSPSRAQAWTSIGGDGDNGMQPIVFPAWPILDQVSGDVVDCSQSQPNSDTPTVFDPVANIVLNTGSEVIDPNTCQNPIDGSAAAMWEFESVRIRSGVTVSFVGVNPALFVVRGDFVIDVGGVVTVAGGKGSNGVTTPNSSTIPNTPGGVPGGLGTAGGGDGGYSYDPTHNKMYGDAGVTDFSPSVGPYMEGGATAGKGGVGQVATPGGFSCPQQFGAAGQGGGGGGHASDGTDGLFLPNQTGSVYVPLSTPDGAGGETIGDDPMTVPTAGAGGGGGGRSDCGAGTNGRARYENEGGGGGAGGGFFGVVASGNIIVHGLIDARGGAGGVSGAGVYTAAGGGGGGAGGGIRLLTSTNIDVTDGTILAGGGVGGIGYRGTLCSSGGGVQQTWVPWNNGGAGGNGRVVFEDGDATLTENANTAVDPGLGDDGYYRSVFDTTRFGGGASGGQALAVTEPISLGSIFRPSEVVFEELEETDFVAGIPGVASLGNDPSMVIEMQGYLPLPDGTLDPTTATGWYVVGYFRDSGNPSAPGWFPDTNPPGFVPDEGVGIDQLNARATFVQVRTTFFVPESMEVTDPGPFVDSMRIRYVSDN